MSGLEVSPKRASAAGPHPGQSWFSLLDEGPKGRPNHWLRNLLLCVLLALVYFLAGRLGLSLAFVHASASAVWPATGLAFAAVLLLGYRVWPGVFAGAFLVNLFTMGSVATSVGIGAGNALEALLGVWLVRRFAGGCAVFRSAPSIFRYVGLVALVATAVSATIGVTSLAAGGYVPWGNYAPVWLTWWLGDMISALTVAPFLVVVAQTDRAAWSRAIGLEAVCLLTVTVGVCGIVFEGWWVGRDEHYAIAFFCIPPSVWAAFRFQQLGAVFSSALIAGFAIWGTLHGTGPFVLESPNESLLLVQAFVGVVGTSMLVLAAVVAQQAAAQTAALASEERLKGIVGRQSLQLAVSKTLARASSADQILTGVLRTVCETLDWTVAVIWTLDREAGLLRCRHFWHAPSAAFEHFEGATLERTFGRGVGLPGRVWESGQPAWIPDVTLDRNFPRAPFAAKDGLRGAFAFPIALGNETVGVMEFFSRAIREPDEDLLAALGSIGVHIGQFLARARAEAELREHREHLERLVARRTDELEQAQAVVRASERLAGLGTLSAGLGHDISNTLFPIRARIDTLAGTPLPRAAREDIEAISKSLDYLSRLSAGMRLLAVDPDREDASGPATDLALWWSEAEGALRSVLPVNVRLLSEIAPRLGVSMPRHHLLQAVFNLVQNAGEAIGKVRHGVVRITVAPAMDGARVLVRVEDDGPGMAPDVAARCFEPYFSTKKRAISTGMGLSLVRGLVCAAKGSVRVETSPREGTVFVLDLPAALAPVRADTDRPRSSVATAAVTVEDARLSSLIHLLLEQQDARLLTAPRDSTPICDLWVTDPTVPSRLAAYLEANPLGRVVVLGGSEPRSTEFVAADRTKSVTVLPAKPAMSELRNVLFGERP